MVDNDNLEDTGTSMIKVCSDFYVDRSVQLGKGNYGTVFKGFQLSRNQIIAVKFMDNNGLKLHKDYERELIIMQDLTKLKHQNIMGYFGYEHKNDGLYCFVELCRGGSLSKLIK
jgi:serine/threonine protein kinase